MFDEVPVVCGPLGGSYCSQSRLPAGPTWWKLQLPQNQRPQRTHVDITERNRAVVALDHEWILGRFRYLQRARVGPSMSTSFCTSWPLKSTRTNRAGWVFLPDASNRGARNHA